MSFICEVLTDLLPFEQLAARIEVEDPVNFFINIFLNF